MNERTEIGPEPDVEIDSEQLKRCFQCFKDREQRLSRQPHELKKPYHPPPTSSDIIMIFTGLIFFSTKEVPNFRRLQNASSIAHKIYSNSGSFGKKKELCTLSIMGVGVVNSDLRAWITRLYIKIRKSTQLSRRVLYKNDTI